MTDVLRIPSDREPVVDTSGRCTRSWYLFFGGLFTRLGGVLGPGVEDAESFDMLGQTADVTAGLYSAMQQLGQLPVYEPPPMPENYAAEIQFLRDQLAEMQKEIQGMRSGLVNI